MDSFNELFKRQNAGQVVLSILFIIYLIMGYETPEPLATLIDNIYGKAAVIILSLALFAYVNPILGVLGFLVAYHLINSASVTTGTYGIQHYLPTETKKSSNLTAMNQFSYTLEQEIVKKMAPLNQSMGSSSQATFTPVLDDQYDAAPIDYTGVV
jgi:hypothetical protein